MNQAQRNVIMGEVLELEDRLNAIDQESTVRHKDTLDSWRKEAVELQRRIAELKEGL